ncbi:alternate-type signal peptide domain-containing protein [Nocardioides sp. QY071]|uniref:alternate-type signal peptide domain-containing protein n=1 Tax=Nocardioides sp. QY071 TaxID=3044187 RepID=UPI00249CDD1F|nr:alternate-type signal peptide domain-containing protein [Nocardioides sp. QY071]WGY04348.1 alternate-type signal peptide domain-containing protein [Nocardioides sp. QY071]
MKKTTKGALAAGTAAVLLMGGAGTLAFWTDSVTATGTSISSGHLKLTDASCGNGWILDGGATYTSQLLVPGDKLTKSCTYKLDIAGEHLKKADFAVTAPTDVTGAQALIDELDVTTSVKRNGVTQASATGVTVANNDSITVDISIDWPYGAEDNDSNQLAGLSATLDGLTVKVTQNHDAA